MSKVDGGGGSDCNYFFQKASRVKEYMKRIGVNVRLEVIQKTALLGAAKILRKALSL